MAEAEEHIAAATQADSEPVREGASPERPAPGADARTSAGGAAAPDLPAPAASKAEDGAGGADAAGKAKLAVYDFDGTCITGNSPAMLVKHLIFDRKLDLGRAILIGFWALAYKLRLPQNESWVRGMVFSAFDGEPKEKVDDYLGRFYEEVVAPRYRPEADSSMRKAASSGCQVLVVSASWDAIVKRASKYHPFHDFISTRMQVDDKGNYTRQVVGVPVEGDEKVNAVRRYADKRFGKGNWELEYAFGDHHSDAPLLETAHHPCAVTPDNPLERLAKKRNWSILDWRKRA